MLPHPHAAHQGKLSSAKRNSSSSPGAVTPCKPASYVSAARRLSAGSQRPYLSQAFSHQALMTTTQPRCATPGTCRAKPSAYRPRPRRRPLGLCTPQEDDPLAACTACAPDNSVGRPRRLWLIDSGEVTDRLKVPVLKTGGRAIAPWVRIPPSPVGHLRRPVQCMDAPPVSDRPWVP